MDDFLEGTFSEDSNGQDHGEAEAVLYSLVHHSEETYNTNMLEFNEDYVHQRNRVSRWETLKQIGDTVKPNDSIFHPQENNKELGHLQFDNNTASKTKTMFGQHFNKRGQNVNYYWNNHRNEKPWNVQNRIGNNYHRNRNLIPVFVQRNEVDQYSVDPQAVLKINNFSSFENPRRNIYAEIRHNESNRENVELVNCIDRISGEGSVNNNLSGTGQNVNTSHNRTNSYGLKVAGDYGASTSKEQSTSSIAGDSSKNTARKESECLLHPSSNVSAVVKDASGVELSSAKITEVVIISDTDGREDCSDESIVEVSPSPKPSPPLVALDSSDESESIVVSNESLVLKVSAKRNKLVSPHSTQTQSTPISSKSIKSPLCTVGAPSKEIKKKKKKKKRHKRITSFECKSWTAGMIQFYNKSWGGETYDHEKLQQGMTTNPSKWKILDVDKNGPVRKYGPFAKVRCANCHQFGHIAKQCPDPKKTICCSMCGERGHLENQCPNKMCLKCGRPAPLFNEGCPSCWNRPQNCAGCGGVDHFMWLCPDVWRKLHSVTTTQEMEIGILRETTYKSTMELNCALCTRKGHLAAECPNRSKETFSSPKNPSLNIFSALQILNKKRKKNRSSFFEGKNKEQEFNKKRRKTN